MKTNIAMEVPEGYVLLQRHNGEACHAACLDGGRFHGWLFAKGPDGQWVSQRKLETWEIMQAEDQRDDNIVQETEDDNSAVPAKYVATYRGVELSRYTIEWTNGPLPIGTKLYAAPVAPAGAQNAQPEKAKAVLDIRAAVNRFLGWRLPKDFSPDSGISFTPYEDALLWPIGTNLFNDDQAKAMFEHCLKDVARPTDDDLWEQTLRDRDTYQEWADKLAEAIAKHFGVDIGEHSNMNCPWSEALDAIEFATPAGAQNAEAIRNQALGDAIEATAKIGCIWIDDSNRAAAAPILNEAIAAVRALQTGSANKLNGSDDE